MSEPYDTLYSVAPIFKKTGPDVADSWLNLAMQFVDSSRFGSSYYLALSYYAAHLMVMDSQIQHGNSSTFGNAAIAGPIARQTAGDVTVAYKDSGKDSGKDMALTFYGRMFLKLARMYCGGATRYGSKVLY